MTYFIIIKQKWIAHFCLLYRFVLLLIVPCTGLQAQDGNDVIAKTALEEYIVKAVYRINITSGFAQKAAAKKTVGVYDMKTRPQPVWGAGIDYRTKVKSEFFLWTGLHVIVSGRNAVFQAPVKEINPNGYQEPYPPLKSNGRDVILSIPLALQKIWKANKNTNVDLQAGLDLRYCLGEDLIEYDHFFNDANGRNINVFHLSFNANNDRTPWIGLRLGGGAQRSLKNGKAISLNLLAHLSATKFVEGDYYISIPGKPLTEGTYNIDGSYVALNITYEFTRWIKKAR